MRLEFEVEKKKTKNDLCVYDVLRKGLCVGTLVLSEEYNRAYPDCTTMVVE